MFKKYIFLIICVLYLCISTQCLLADEKKKNDGHTIKSGVKSIVSGIVSSGKEAVSGLSEGFDEGRKAGSSVDGAYIISNREELEDNLTLKPSKLEEQGNKKVVVTLDLRNIKDSIFRVTNLNANGSILLIDQDGFAYPLATLQNNTDVTVYPNSGTRIRAVFHSVEEKPVFIRIFGKDYPLPQPVKSGTLNTPF